MEEQPSPSTDVQPTYIQRAATALKQRTRQALSPWVRQRLGANDTGEQAPTSPGKRADVPLTLKNTQALLSRAQRRLDRAVVWKPDVGALKPDLVRNFSRTITNRSQALDLVSVRRHPIEPTREFENAVELPLAVGPGASDDASTVKGPSIFDLGYALLSKSEGTPIPPMPRGTPIPPMPSRSKSPKKPTKRASKRQPPSPNTRRYARVEEFPRPQKEPPTAWEAIAETTRQSVEKPPAPEPTQAQRQETSDGEPRALPSRATPPTPKPPATIKSAPHTSAATRPQPGRDTAPSLVQRTPTTETPSRSQSSAREAKPQVPSRPPTPAQPIPPYAAPTPPATHRPTTTSQPRVEPVTSLPVPPIQREAIKTPDPTTPPAPTSHAEPVPQIFAPTHTPREAEPTPASLTTAKPSAQVVFPEAEQQESVPPAIQQRATKTPASTEPAASVPTAEPIHEPITPPQVQRKETTAPTATKPAPEIPVIKPKRREERLPLTTQHIELELDKSRLPETPSAVTYPQVEPFQVQRKAVESPSASIPTARTPVKPERPPLAHPPEAPTTQRQATKPTAPSTPRPRAERPQQQENVPLLTPDAPVMTLGRDVLDRATYRAHIAFSKPRVPAPQTAMNVQLKRKPGTPSPALTPRAPLYNQAAPAWAASPALYTRTPPQHIGPQPTLTVLRFEQSQSAYEESPTLTPTATRAQPTVARTQPMAARAQFESQTTQDDAHLPLFNLPRTTPPSPTPQPAQRATPRPKKVVTSPFPKEEPPAMPLAPPQTTPPIQKQEPSPQPALAETIQRTPIDAIGTLTAQSSTSVQRAEGDEEELKPITLMQLARRIYPIVRRLLTIERERMPHGAE